MEKIRKEDIYQTKAFNLSNLKPNKNRTGIDKFRNTSGVGKHYIVNDNIRESTIRSSAELSSQLECRITPPLIIEARVSKVNWFTNPKEEEIDYIFKNVPDYPVTLPDPQANVNYECHSEQKLLFTAKNPELHEVNTDVHKRNSFKKRKQLQKAHQFMKNTHINAAEKSASKSKKLKYNPFVTSRCASTLVCLRSGRKLKVLKRGEKGGMNGAKGKVVTKMKCTDITGNIAKTSKHNFERKASTQFPEKKLTEGKIDISGKGDNILSSPSFFNVLSKRKENRSTYRSLMNTRTSKPRKVLIDDRLERFLNSCSSKRLSPRSKRLKTKKKQSKQCRKKPKSTTRKPKNYRATKTSRRKKKAKTFYKKKKSSTREKLRLNAKEKLRNKKASKKTAHRSAKAKTPLRKSRNFHSEKRNKQTSIGSRTEQKEQGSTSNISEGKKTAESLRLINLLPIFQKNESLNMIAALEKRHPEVVAAIVSPTEMHTSLSYHRRATDSMNEATNGPKSKSNETQNFHSGDKSLLDETKQPEKMNRVLESSTKEAEQFDDDFRHLGNANGQTSSSDDVSCLLDDEFYDARTDLEEDNTNTVTTEHKITDKNLDNVQTFLNQTVKDVSKINARSIFTEGSEVQIPECEKMEGMITPLLPDHQPPCYRGSRENIYYEHQNNVSPNYVKTAFRLLPDALPGWMRYVYDIWQSSK